LSIVCTIALLHIVLFKKEKNRAAWLEREENSRSHDTANGPCHVSGIPLQKGFFPLLQRRKTALLGWRVNSLEGKKT
jgi:hypothetical protein